MKCPKCHSEVAAEFLFCPKCGAEVPETGCGPKAEGGEDEGSKGLGDLPTAPRTGGPPAARPGAAEPRNLQSLTTEVQAEALPAQAAAGPGGFKPGHQLLGRYRVVGELGRGGMGVVYRCLDEISGIDVALKSLPPQVAHSTSEMSGVRENFRTVERLHHPNIAALKTLELDPAGGAYYLVMELAEGTDLHSWRKRQGGKVGLESCLPILRQIAQALDYAHSRKIIHRDLKPANVMLGPDGAVKLLDLGLAAQIQTSLSRLSQAPYRTSGTGPYMAPEQWRGQRQTGATDQYALAVTACELLAGRLPFEAPDKVALRESVLREPPERPEGIGNAVWAALSRGLAKERSQRFPSCAEFVDALETGKPGRAKPPPAVAGPPKPMPAPPGPRDRPHPRLDKPWTNSLGMRFAPVPGTKVLFSIWDTRVMDYAAYAAANTGVDGGWRGPAYRNVLVTPSETCPVVNVSWDDAKAFCRWLTGKERAEGRIGPDQSYRLPTDEEWSCAVGIGEREAGGTPGEKSGKLAGLYPWGAQWPPPPGAGNYASESAREKFGHDWQIIEGYDDGYVTTSPVDSFEPNRLGLHDMGGNVWQWCEDFYDGRSGLRVLRGASWYDHTPAGLLSSYRLKALPHLRSINFGFRVVL